MLLVTTPIALQIASLLSALDVTPIKICETDIGSDTGIAAVSLVLCNPHCSVQWGFVIVDTVCELPITYKSWNVGVGTFYTAATNQTRATSINPTLNTVKLVANYNEGPANGYYLCVGK